MTTKLLFTFLLCFSTSVFSQTFFCNYIDMEDQSGNVTVKVEGDSLSARFGRNTYSASNCEVDRTFSSEVIVTCDENSGRGMGLTVSESGGKYEGYLVVEKLSFFAEIVCR